MSLITNRKIAVFRPVWAPFHGFSLLFNNPGNGLKNFGDLQKIACKVDSNPDLSLYRALAESMETMGPDKMMRAYLFCALPYESYHVTIWDGVNDGNKLSISMSQREKLGPYIEGFPDTFFKPPEIIELIKTSGLSARFDLDIRFKFEKVAVWSNRALVACLAPADEASKKTLNQMLVERKKLNDSIGGLLDINMHKVFKPHVSLGYFANPEFAKRFRADLEKMRHIFKENTGNSSITFESVSLYGFTDMTTFFRR